MSLIDLFKGFHSRAVVNAYPTSARALFDYFLYDFNAAFWPEERIYSERELSRLTGLTPASTHRAMKFLAERRHIKVRTSKRGTIIKLVEYQRSTSEAPTEHQRSTGGAISSIPNTHGREDVKTEDVKTSHKQAHARDSKEDDDIFEYWRKMTESPILGINKYDLLAKAEENSELTKQAIVKAMQTKTTFLLQYEHFKKVYIELKNPKPKQQLRLLRGGERNDRKPVVEADPRSEFVFDD